MEQQKGSVAGLRHRRTLGNTWRSCRTGQRRRSGEPPSREGDHNIFGRDLGAVKEKLEAEAATAAVAATSTDTINVAIMKPPTPVSF